MTQKVLKYSAVCVASVLLIFLFLYGFMQFQLWRHEVFKEATYDTIPPVIVTAVDKPNILVFSKTNSFRHIDAIPAVNSLFSEEAKNRNWAVFQTENAAVHNTEDLAKFDLIIWNNVAGDVLTKEQRGAFKSYLETGGQLLALHGSGGDAGYRWKWYPEQIIRAQFRGHPLVPQFQTASLVVEDRDHPATIDLPNDWRLKDEWYSFVASPRERVNVLVALNEDTYNPSTILFGGDLKMGDHPIVWWHQLGEGRVFYSAIGDKARVYRDPHYKEMLINATEWLLTVDEFER